MSGYLTSIHLNVQSETPEIWVTNLTSQEIEQLRKEI